MDKNVRIASTIEYICHLIQGKQNEELKRLLQIQVTHEPIRMQSKREFQSIQESNGHGSSYPVEETVVGRTSIQLKKEWAEWSNRLEASIVSKHNKIRHQTEFEDLRKTTNLSSGSHGNDGFFARKSLQSVKSGNSQQVINLQLKSQGKSQSFLPQQQQNLSLIQDIFLFGPSINDIQRAQQRKFIANHQLYYPQSQKPDFQSYGYYLFPNQLEVKHIREKNQAVELNKIIFKNNKKLDCNVFIFWRQESNLKLNRPNKILDRVNPSKWLYGLSIEFSDFVSAQNEHITSSKNNKTFSMASQLTQKNERYVEGQLIQQRMQEKQMGGSTSKKNIMVEQQIFRSNFCLCIMTYFPFIRFLKDILIEVFDSVKLKRMNKYSNCSSFKSIDIFYFIEELKLQLSKFMDQKLKIVPEINQSYEFTINEVQMKLDLKENNLVNQVLADWAFKILKMLDKDSLMDVFCYMAMEETIIFVAEDRNILTFVILLYVVVLSLPFGYPHPSISVVFNQTLLETPFTGILGVNKNTKWLEENLQWLTQNKQNKIVVNLNEQEIKIKFKKKPRTHKSQKLKKIFTSFYKKIQTSAIPSIFKKKMELISRETTKEENDLAAHMVNELHSYYQQELLNHLPNKQIIELIRQSFVTTCKQQQAQKNPNAVSEILVEKIQRYMAESRKAKNSKETKDPFIDQLVKKQLFRLYIDKVYDIK